MMLAALIRSVSRPTFVRTVTVRHTQRVTRPQARIACAPQLGQRSFATVKSVDEKMEEIQDQYGTAQDGKHIATDHEYARRLLTPHKEFEIATEETDKMSVYAEEDRRAAREEFDKLEALYQAALNEEGGEQVRQRVGQRIRELKSAVENLEEIAKNQD